MLELCLESIILIENIKEKTTSSNIIVPLPKKSVAPSEKVEGASGNSDDIEAPVVTICRKII